MSTNDWFLNILMTLGLACSFLVFARFIDCLIVWLQGVL